MTAATIVVGVADAGFFVCALLTWWTLYRQGTNRPGQMVLWLLVAARGGELAHRLPLGLVPASRWSWLLTTAFSFLLVYAIYQMGRLLAEVRDRQATVYQRQPLELLRLASYPGRPRHRRL